MERAAIYARVSTDEQVDGFSIGAQLKALHHHALQQGWEVVTEFVDEGESARTADRPQFQAMISAAKRKPKPFDIILVHKLDRFARNREDSSIYKSLLRRECGIEVRSVTEQIDDSPVGRAMEGMLEVFAEFYSLNLAQEVLKGQRERALQGKAMQLPPIGYRMGKDGRYEVDPETAPIVRWLFAQYAQGRDGYRSLAFRMREDGATLFGPVVNGYSWTQAYARKILNNEAYCGTFIWGKRDRSKNLQLRDRSKWVVVEGAHAALVSRETFDRVQQLLRSRHGVRRAQEGQDYLLRGMVRCLDCGSTMIKYRFQWDDRKTGERIVRPSFLCSAYSRHGKCYHNRVDMPEVEAAVLGYLAQLLQGHFDPNTIAVTRTKRKEDEEELEALRRRIGAIDNKVQRVVDAYAAGALSLELLTANTQRFAAEKAALQRQATLLEQSVAAEDPERMAREIKARIQAIMSTASDPNQDIAKRRDALESVVDSVQVSRKQAVCKVVIKL